MDWKGHKEYFRGNGNILDLDYSGDILDIYSCQTYQTVYSKWIVYYM